MRAPVLRVVFSGVPESFPHLELEKDLSIFLSGPSTRTLFRPV